MLSIALLFSLLVAGLSGTLRTTVATGLTAQGVPAAAAQQVAHDAPAADLFAAFLGDNPVPRQLAPTGALAHLSPDSAAALANRHFFPHLISGPFHRGLVYTFTLAAVLLMVAAGILSLSRQAPPQGRAPSRSYGRSDRSSRAIRWSLAVVVSIAAFVGTWWVCQEHIGLDEGAALGVAGAVLAVVLAVAGWWAARERSGGDSGAGVHRVVQKARAGGDVNMAGQDQVIVNHKRRDE